MDSYRNCLIEAYSCVADDVRLILLCRVMQLPLCPPRQMTGREWSITHSRSKMKSAAKPGWLSTLGSASVCADFPHR
eukprot:3124288-Rhodomonas_salina.1